MAEEFCSRNETEGGTVAGPCTARGEDLAGLRPQGRLRECGQLGNTGLCMSVLTVP